MAAIAPQQATEAGTAAITLTAASAGGDTMTFHDTLVLWVVNSNASTRTITIAEQLASNTVADSRLGDLTKADASVVVSGTSTAIIGPFKAASFRDSNGDINITYSTEVGLTVAGVYI